MANNDSGYTEAGHLAYLEFIAGLYPERDDPEDEEGEFSQLLDVLKEEKVEVL